MIVITTGFSVSQHFCHNRLVNTELFSATAQSCHEMPESCCDRKQTYHCSVEIDQDDCCKNESALVKFTGQFTVSQRCHPEDPLFSVFNITLPDFYTKLAFTQDMQGVQLRIVQPPPLEVNILTFIQSFLI